MREDVPETRSVSFRTIVATGKLTGYEDSKRGARKLLRDALRTERDTGRKFVERTNEIRPQFRTTIAKLRLHRPDWFDTKDAVVDAIRAEIARQTNRLAARLETAEKKVEEVYNAAEAFDISLARLAREVRETNQKEPKGTSLAQG